MRKFQSDLIEQGYCVVPNVIAKSQISRLRDLNLNLFDQSGLITLKPNDFLKNPEVSDILFSSEIVHAISTVVGEKFCIYPDFTIRKSLYIPWHTDTSYLSSSDTDSHEESDMVQMSIYLQDNDLASGGGLEIIPGSHRYKNLNRKDLLTNEIDFGLAKLMPSMAGDLVFWDSRIIHRSSNQNKKSKVKLAIQWTISKTERFSAQYIQYLIDRVMSRQKHVSDKIGTREHDYLNGIKEVRFPESFSEQHREKIKFFGLKVKTL